MQEIGAFRYDELKIYSVSMEDYEKDIENLRKSNFEVTSYGNGYLNGKLNAEESGILQFSTIYDKGWKVYVDGEKVDTFVTNEYFLGIEINKGEHIIELRYTTPYLITGLCISFIGAIIFIGIIVYKRKNKN